MDIIDINWFKTCFFDKKCKCFDRIVCYHNRYWWNGIKLRPQYNRGNKSVAVFTTELTRLRITWKNVFYCCTHSDYESAVRVRVNRRQYLRNVAPMNDVLMKSAESVPVSTFIRRLFYSVFKLSKKRNTQNTEYKNVTETILWWPNMLMQI